MGSSIFMQCSIFKEGSDLNIEIYKGSRRKKIITLGRTLEGDLVCQVNIKFDDLWRHLVSESQKETKCKLIFVSIASNGLRIPQQISRQNWFLQSQECSSGLSPRYDQFWSDEDPYSNIIVGIWQWFTLYWHQNREYNWKLEQFQADLEPSRFRKRWCWDIYWVRKGCWRGKSFLNNTHAHYLTQKTAQLYSEHGLFLHRCCISSWPLSCFQGG